MKTGKEKCEILKAIRSYVAEKYDVEYSPSECDHQGECKGTCPKCDAELADLQKKLEAKGISDIAEDEQLRDLVEKYLSKTSMVDDYQLSGTDIDIERTAGIPMTLQGDIDIDITDEEKGLCPDIKIVDLERDAASTCEDKKLFIECGIAGISFHDIDDIWDELQVGTKLALVRERNNAYDKNAVAVALAGDYDGNPDDFDFDFILGYIPRKDNELLAAMLDNGCEGMFDAEICGLKKYGPYSDRIRISIYVKNKENQKKDNRLRMMLFREEEWKLFSDELWEKGYAYFLWDGCPPWEKDFPGKGDKVVFLNMDGPVAHLYLMQTIAVGNAAAPYVDDSKEYLRIDGYTEYALTNVAGPLTIDSSELQLPQDVLQRHRQPDERLPQDLSDRLMRLFADHQYSGNANE